MIEGPGIIGLMAVAMARVLQAVIVYGIGPKTSPATSWRP